MQGAPAPAAAFLTVVPTVGAVIALTRLLQLFGDTMGWRLLVEAMAIATMTLGSLAAVLTLALLSLTGIPPLAGFAGKLMLFITTLDAGYTVLAEAALANTVISLLYYLRVLAPMVFEPAPTAAVEVLVRGPACGVAVARFVVVAIGLGAGVMLSGFGAVGLLP